MVDEPEDEGTEAVTDETEITLDADGALVQAANVLIAAAEKAELLNDVTAMMKIAGGWMEIHEYLAGVPHHEAKKQPLGFAPAKPPTQEQEEEELDDAVAAEGKSKRGLHAEYGKLRKPQSRYRRRG